MKPVAKLVLKDSFDATNTLIAKGQIGTFDADRLTGKEKHLKDVGGFEPAIVQIAPIAPTGPNPRNPQQIPPDAVQTAGGGYALPGKELVGAVTEPGKDRQAQVEGGKEDKVTKMLEKALGQQTGAADSTEGDTVATATAGIADMSDEDLDTLEANEKNRDKPRAGVLGAVKAERAKRAAQ